MADGARPADQSGDRHFTEEEKKAMFNVSPKDIQHDLIVPARKPSKHKQIDIIRPGDKPLKF